jgi:murein DD-endopeptidase MepM/ murein hydrolase activator NlpD
VFLGFVLFDYYNLKTAFMNTNVLKAQISNQIKETDNQRKQIQLFADDINQLKAKLVDLNAFEKKIRIIANIEKNLAQENLFGVGGSIPEDLDVSLKLKDPHNSLIREMHDQTDQLKLATKTQKEDFSSLFDQLKSQRNLLACTPAVRPTQGWITSRFGYRTSPFTGLREFHKGLDIATRKGTPIRTTADGVISSITRKGLLGKVIVINHGHGMMTRYAHINEALKKQGDQVKRGEEIATVGNSGRTTGPHLHYEVILNGLPVNPEKYILN